MAQERLQKILARAGAGARRKCEELIAEGRVTVNGAVVTEPGSKADPVYDEILLDGKPLLQEKKIYIMLNKPAGCLTTAQPDSHGRPTVMDFLRNAPARVFPVGRLDFDTEGLLLFTNDGEFANRVMHPSHGIVKTYEAVVENRPSADTLENIRRGMMLDDGLTAPAQARLLGKRTASRPCANRRPGGPVEELVRGTVVEIKIHEGRKRIVRRMLQAAGHPALALRRTAVGGLGLGSLAQGKTRALTESEKEKIFNV